MMIVLHISNKFQLNVAVEHTNASLALVPTLGIVHTKLLCMYYVLVPTKVVYCNSTYKLFYFNSADNIYLLYYYQKQLSNEIVYTNFLNCIGANKSC